jgi:hypothetical protein
VHCLVESTARLRCKGRIDCFNWRTCAALRLANLHRVRQGGQRAACSQPARAASSLAPRRRCRWIQHMSDEGSALAQMSDKKESKQAAAGAEKGAADANKAKVRAPDTRASARRAARLASHR